MRISDLIKSSGKSAPQMTHALKHLGNGDMQKGITRISNYFTKEGVKIGEERGFIRGAAGVSGLFLLIFLIRKAMLEHQKHKVEGEAILKGLEDGLTDYEINKSKDSSCGCVEVKAQEDTKLPDNQKL